ncbi:hypothetical protein ASG36_14585 [Geodermatophilus sp. Leaf369]|nr:hypothetical protein ASG36_14585 [Geodermatophilus sp. Leaf369]
MTVVSVELAEELARVQDPVTPPVDVAVVRPRWSVSDVVEPVRLYGWGRRPGLGGWHGLIVTERGVVQWVSASRLYPLAG